MSWIKCKSVWFSCPHFADVFEGCESLEGLQPPTIIVGVNEVVEMRGQLGMAVIMSKIRPYGGAKVDQFLVERDGCKMAAASQPRSPNSWRLTGRFGPSGPNLDWLDQVAAFAFRARLWPSR